MKIRLVQGLMRAEAAGLEIKRIQAQFDEEMIKCKLSDQQSLQGLESSELVDILGMLIKKNVANPTEETPDAKIEYTKCSLEVNKKYNTISQLIGSQYAKKFITSLQFGSQMHEALKTYTAEMQLCNQLKI